jgi:RNA polymerase sigma-70 factor (ECF subfamily)
MHSPEGARVSIVEDSVAASFGTGSHSGDAGDPSLESTATLVQFAQAGDRAARNLLVRRFLPVLTRWAHGRLPSYARDLSETGDLVQKTLIKALRGIDGFEYRREGAFIAWLRQVFINEVRDEIRRAGRKPWKVELPDDLAARTPSPLAHVLSQETFAAYDAALAKLRPRTREAVILRLEFGYSYPQIVQAIGSTSENATRMLVTRAVVQVAQALSEQRGDALSD